MPKPSPLNKAQAKHTLAHRLAGRADRLRQLATRFGIRPYRVFLVWCRSDGDEVTGFGEEVFRKELLPTPKVRSNLTRSLISGGIVPMGSVELTEVSCSVYTYEQLIGRDFPERGEVSVPPPYEFHYEVVEDGRGADQPRVAKYRPFGEPFREASMLQWTLTLAPVSSEEVA